MRRIIYLVLILTVGVIGCPGGVNERPCDTNDFCVETASCVQKSDDTWCTLVDPMNIEIEEWLQASVGNPYQVSVTAVGGFGPYTWELIRSNEEKLEWLTITWDGDGTTAYLVNKDEEFPTKADVGDIDLTLRLIDASIKGTDIRVDNQGFNFKKTLTIVDAVAVPTLDPDPGTYNEDQDVSISCDIVDARIYYTTNGDDPTTSSTEYTTPISVAGDQTTMTIRAISAKDGLANSTIIEGIYIISYDHIFVTYHGNGNTSGDAPTDPTDYDAGQQVSVLDQGDLLKTGHSFEGWNIKSDGTGDDYAAGDTFNIGEDNVNLYAQWTPYQTVAVPVFDPNPGTYNSDQQVSISCDTAEARIYYTTNGDDPTTSSTEYTTPISVAGDQTNMTIRAISVKDGMVDSMIVEGTYIISYEYISVIYHGNGNTSGDAPIDPTDYNDGQQVNVLEQGDLLKTGYIFACWNTKSDGNGDDYAAGSTFDIGEDNVNLYAQWTPIQYEVTFDSQGGSAVAPQTVNYDGYATAPVPAPSWAGHSFGGWYKESGCTTAWDFETDTVTANVKLYAQWTSIKYEVTFDSQGGSAVEKQIVNYDGYATAPVPDPIWAGYTFGGWYKESGCTTAWDFDNDTVTADVKLYALWTNTQTETLGGVSFDMKYVPGGTFPTGTDDSGEETVSNAYGIGETEVTYELWSAVYAWATSNGYTFANPGAQGYGAGATDQHPVTTISWRDAIVWCNAASELAGGAAAGYGPVYKYNGAVVRDSTNATACDEVTADNTAKGYRLPLSMEWECAARYRGTDTTNSILSGGIYWTKGNSASGATASYEDPAANGFVAWYSGNSGSTTHEVGEKDSNTLGLHDMSGNVYEWCFDIYSVSSRVLRGGSFIFNAAFLRVGYVHYIYPSFPFSNFGFRFLRTL